MYKEIKEKFSVFLTLLAEWIDIESSLVILYHLNFLWVYNFYKIKLMLYCFIIISWEYPEESLRMQVIEEFCSLAVLIIS